MPDQEQKIRKDLLFWSGFFSFSVAGNLFLQVFTGNFPEIIPYFLIFFLSLTFGSWLGRDSENLFLRYVKLIFAFSSLFFFRQPECFALIGGFIAGCISADAFLSGQLAEERHGSGYVFIYGGILGIAFPLFVVFWGTLIASVGYSCSILFRKGKKWQSVCGFLFSLIILPLIFYVSGIVQPQTEDIRKIPVPANIKRDAAWILHPSNAERILLITSADRDSSLIRAWRFLADTQKSKLEVRYYGMFRNVRAEIRETEQKFDMILIDLYADVLPLMSREFIRELKSKLNSDGAVFYYLQDGDLNRAVSMYAALSGSFQHTRVAGGIFMLAASEKPLEIRKELSGEMILESLIFPADYEEEIVLRSKTAVHPSDSGFAFEREQLKRRDNIILNVYHRYFPFSPRGFVCFLGGVILLFVMLRYSMAYIQNMGLRLTVYRDSALVLLIPGVLFCSKNLVYPENGYCYVFALTVFASGLLAGWKIPGKFAPLTGWAELILLGISCLLFGSHGSGIFYSILALFFAAGCILPLAVRGSLEKYKTGTSGDIEVFPVICSGLLTAAVLLAVMPDHLNFGSILP